MSLRINNFTHKIPHIIFAIFGLSLVACLIKVALWEHSYYTEKEGTKREPIVEIGISAPETEEVDETEVTIEEKQIYTVAPDKPRYLFADFMGPYTGARIREVGLTPSGAMATLPNIFDIAWYRDSSRPGYGGTIIINAHNGGPTKNGAFKHLDQVEIGDVITIERGDGQVFRYEVADSKILPLNEANQYMSEMQDSPIPGRESLSLISCTGEWSQQQRTYLSRSMVRATLMDEEISVR